MLQMLSIDVADTCCWVLQTLNFHVADIEFLMLQTSDVGICVEDRRRRGELLMLDVARNMSRNMVATWGRREERLLMLDVARNVLATCTQCARNMLATFTRWTLDLTADD
jgi:hypothetical protein